MFREIRNVQQRRPREKRRWFQDDYFDLFLTEDGAGELQWFQLCYARDTWRERVLEWRRGRGFQHMRRDERPDHFTKDRNALLFDGVLPYVEVSERFAAAAGGLPRDIAALVAEKVREYARPSRRFRPRDARTPLWVERMRTRERIAARLRFLDTEEASG